MSRLDMVPTILSTLCETLGLGIAAVSQFADGRWIVSHVHDTTGIGPKTGDEFDVLEIVGDRGRDALRPTLVSECASPPIHWPNADPIAEFRSYIAHPAAHPDGTGLATLVALDPKEIDLESRGHHAIFPRFADLIGFSLQQTSELVSREADFVSQHEAAAARERFIAIMGHDLRNPLAAIQSGIRLLENQPAAERAALVLAQMKSSAERMASLIADVLDLTRSRSGGGIVLKREPVFINPVIVQVVAELTSTHPDHMISAECSFDHPIDCDPDRFAQLLSNLLGNALTHGSSERPVRIICESSETVLLLSVTNGGKRISPDKFERLFQPFVRGGAGDDRDGLGLGLFIAAQIASAHGGELTVSSTDDETRFSFQMPLAPTPR